ncbi:MAG: patatin-like phospholipase family protein [Myxococcales bacterium]|nr:patatin-like phospholipase family protein [Myxococcales bacterium]
MPRLLDDLRGRRVGVALSSAFFGFYAHTGFLRALRARGVEPVAYSGSSAGALVAAFAAGGGLDRLPPLFAHLQRSDFWDPSLPFGRPPGLLRGDRFRALLATHLPVDRFEHCAHKLVTVATDLSRGARHTDFSGPLAPAVHASCALPLLFRPVRRDGALHADGGIVDKVPLTALLEHAEVDAVLVHFIPSAGLARPLPRGPWGLLDRLLDVARDDVDRLLDVARDDGWRHQVDLARARGVEVHVITSHPPRVTPFTLRRGLLAMGATEAEAGRALDG